jgi:pyruvate, water dikinase
MINSSWGLGEAIVSGVVIPDEYIINKKTGDIINKTIVKKNKMIVKKINEIIDTEIIDVAKYLGADKVDSSSLSISEVNKLVDIAIKIEKLYGKPQDIEWGFDRETENFYILQSRPITGLKEYKGRVSDNKGLKSLIRGLSASPGIASGKVVLIRDFGELSRVEEGSVLVTEMTNPDMVPAMRKAVAVVTNEGGRTCHAAIVSRELGIPCIVGAGEATEILKDNMEITVDATRGVVYKGLIKDSK